MNRLALSLIFVLIGTSLFAQLNIIPKPVSAVIGSGTFQLNATVKIVAPQKDLLKQAAFLNEYLDTFFGFKLSIVKKALPTDCVLTLDNKRQKNKITGAYQLLVDGKQISIAGDDSEGVFYGIQTLIQLLPTASKVSSLAIPQVKITDASRFAYRGMMLDAGRHFYKVAFVKKFIDFLALHKLNNFHWHLTEDQGWRIEIKKYPLLTKVGSMRHGTVLGPHPGTGNDNKPHGGFYTQQEIREVVKYAEDRFITVIPEIEMPGHSSAAIAAYPQLSCFPDEATKPAKGVTWAGPQTGKQVQQAWSVYNDVFCPTEYTFKFIEDVLDEVLALFPSKYIHIGGDECPKDAWKRSAFCQQLIKEKGLKDEHGLQSYFIGRIEKYLNKKGRDIIGWDEILEGGLAPNATVMSWRGEKGGIEAAKQKHKVIMSPTTYIYLDYKQNQQEDSLTFKGYLPLEKVYSYNPLPKELTVEEQQYIIGAQANVWTEYISNPSKIEYMIFPRAAAFSEVMWTPQEKRSWPDFQERLKIQLKRYDLWNVNYNGKQALTKAK